MNDVKLTISKEATRIMRVLQDRVGLGRAIAQAMDYENELTVRLVKEKLNGPVLKRDTGHLSDSIGRTDAVVIAAATGRSNAVEIRSSIGSNVRFGGKSVEYAAIHEFGGRTKPHVILPKKGKALSFVIGGAKVTVAKVNHPGSVMPERSYVRSSIRERLPQYGAHVSRNIVSFFKASRGEGQSSG